MSAAQPLLSARQQRVAAGIDRAVAAIAGAWLAALFLLGLAYAGLPILAPVLATHGHGGVARVIYAAFRLACHQRPERSFHLYGAKMAFCERDLAIYATATLLLPVYGLARARRHVAPLRTRWLLACALPIALDGGTQLLGLHESTWELRVLTGALFSFGAAWFALPHLDRGFAEVAAAAGAREAAP